MFLVAGLHDGLCFHRLCWESSVAKDGAKQTAPPHWEENCVLCQVLSQFWVQASCTCSAWDKVPDICSPVALLSWTRRWASVTLILLAEMPIAARESYARGLKTISVCPFKAEVPYLAQIQIEIFIIHDSMTQMSLTWICILMTWPQNE